MTGIAEELRGLGVASVEELKDRDPAELYARMCIREGGHVDRCVLYVFRCAVYFAETPDPDPELLRWWAWKDRPHPRETAADEG